MPVPSSFLPPIYLTGSFGPVPPTWIKLTAALVTSDQFGARRFPRHAPNMARNRNKCEMAI